MMTYEEVLNKVKRVVKEADEDCLKDEEVIEVYDNVHDYIYGDDRDEYVYNMDYWLEKHDAYEALTVVRPGFFNPDDEYAYATQDNGYVSGNAGAMVDYIIETEAMKKVIEEITKDIYNKAHKIENYPEAIERIIQEIKESDMEPEPEDSNYLEDIISESLPLDSVDEDWKPALTQIGIPYCHAKAFIVPLSKIVEEKKKTAEDLIYHDTLDITAGYDQEGKLGLMLKDHKEKISKMYYTKGTWIDGKKIHFYPIFVNDHE